MAQAKIIYDLVGGTDFSRAAPNIEGTALAVNCFTESNTEGDNKNVRTFLQSAPGVKYFDTFGSSDHCDGLYVPSTGLAAYDFEQCLFVAYNGEVFRVDSALNHEKIGIYALGNTVQFAESGGERAILMWVDGTDIHGYNLKTGETVNITLPKRIDAQNQYIQPTHIAVVDGSIVLNDKGSSFTYYSIKYPLNTAKRKVFKIINGKVQYESDKITVSTMEVDSGVYCFLDDYGVQKYFNGSTSSDKCVAISSVGPLLTLFGPSSIEFWQKGNAESYQSWQRTSYTINKEQGLEAPYSIASVNHQQFCIGTGKANAKCVLMISGTEVRKISPLWLDRVLADNDVKSVVGWTYSKNNHSFYLFSIQNKCYVYDATTSQWHIRQSRNYYTGTVKNYMPLFAVWWNNRIITGSSDSGHLYELDENYFYEDFDSENRLPLLRVRQTPVVTSNYKPFVIYELAIECNTGAMENYDRPAKALLEVSRDGGYTFGNVLESSCGRRGQYSYRLKWLNLGMNRQCVLRISYSEPTDFVMSDSEIRFKELSTPM
ncbi:MAG: hypothetical protein IIY21_15470 [Clostridiales bacterium]|nr:hypothetical protein [Clostridiales bacterium]MBQ1571913.1 hypothetical protein [Clostridiales bacterium]